MNSITSRSYWVSHLYSFQRRLDTTLKEQHKCKFNFKSNCSPIANNKHQEYFRFSFRFGRCEWTLSVRSYLPPTKVREGNVFTGVCHYVGGIPSLMSGEEVGTWDTHPSARPGIPTPATLLLSSGGHHWKPVQTCSPTPWPPWPRNWYRHLVAATDTRTVGKRAVRILLEYFLFVVEEQLYELFSRCGWCPTYWNAFLLL